MQRLIIAIMAATLAGGATLQAQTPGQAPPGQRPPGQAPAGQAPAGQRPPGQGPAGQGPAGQRPPGQRPPGGPPAPPAAGPGEVRGTVVDAETSAPISQASVAVWSTADSALVAGALARPDDTFRIQGLRPGTYYLKVSMMGYGAHVTSEFTVAQGSARSNAGSIRLSRSAITLQALEVTAEQGTTIAPDRNAYRTRDVAPAATTASEVLEAVPSVQVDADGVVSLRGNENVVVQINGRPSPIRGAQLAGYLKQLPANTLERVEVIPNPSARQDPEGMAGIINIVLKQNVDLGLSGGLTLATSTAGRYMGSGNLGWQQGPTTLFVNYGYTSDAREETGINDRTRLGAQRAPVSFTETDINSMQGLAAHNLNATLDYRLGERDVVSNALLLNMRGFSNESLSAYNELDGTRALLDAYQRVRDVRRDDQMFDYTLGWKRTLEPQRHELSAEVRVNRTHDEERTDLWRQAAAAATRREAETNVTDTHLRQLTAQLDYTRAFGARSKVETGYKGTARSIERDFSVLLDPAGTGNWVRGALSNALEFDETVNAVYGVLSHGTGKLELQGGLRAEYATRDFLLTNDNQSYPYNYTSLFPSALVSYNLTNQTQVKASYSRRIRRPGSQELNPFPVFFDLQNVFMGNPRLNPEYTDAIELGVQHSTQNASVQLSPFYRRTTDVIRFVINPADTVAGREAASISFRNLDTGSSWGADLNGNLRVGQAFNGTAGFNLFKMVTEGTSGESAVSSDAVTWMARFNGTWNMTPRTAFSLGYFYRAPMNVEGGRMLSMSMTNLSVRQKLYGEKANLTLRLSDPFLTQRFGVQAGNDQIIQLTRRSFTSSRALHLTLQYNFGRAPRVKQQPQQQPEPSSSPFGG